MKAKACVMTLPSDVPISHSPDYVGPKISFFLFNYGGLASEVLPAHVQTVISMISQNRAVSWNAIREDALIDRSRCRAVGFFLLHKTDVMIMVDHDIYFEPDDIWGACEKALEHDALVGVPYSKRKAGGKDAGRHHVPLPLPGTDELTEVTFLASGFLAIPISCIHKIIQVCSSEQIEPEFRVHIVRDVLVPTFPTLFKPMIVNQEYLSEDYSFCARAQVSDVKCLAWTKPNLKHYGMFPYVRY